MAAISLTDFTSQQADIQRRQKLAEMLSEQGNQEIPIQSYNGIQAAIPWTAVLAKALQAGAGAYIAHKSSDDQDALQQKINDTQAGLVSQYYGSPAAPSQSSSPSLAFDSTSAAPGEPNMSGPATSGPSPQALAAMLGNVPNDDYAGAAAGNPIAQDQPQPQAPPPQAMAAALAQNSMGSNDDYQGAANAQNQGAPPAPMPQMQPAPQQPQSPPSMSVASQAPPAAAPPGAPVAPVAPPNPIQAMAAEAQRKMQIALQAQRQVGSTPVVQTMLKDAQEQVKKVQDLQAAAAEKEADRSSAVARTTTLINSSDMIPAALKPTFLAGAQADPDLAKTIMTKMVNDAFTKQLVPATPQDLAGYPQGTVAQKDPLTGKLENVYNPIPDLMSQARVKLEAQSNAISAGHLALDRAKFNQDSLAPPTTVETMVNGEPVQTTAMFDKKHGRFVNMQGQPIDPTGLRVIPGGGSRAAMGILRMSTAAADAATGIDNLAKLPANSSLGWFSQAGNTPLGALKRTLTPQQAQDMRVTVAGLSRAMGGLATGGLAVDIPTQQSYENLIPQAGQTQLTALRQMGELKQQALNGIDSVYNTPYTNPDQKKALDVARAKIQSAIPWTPNDISALENSKNPNATMHGMGVGRFPGAGANAAGPPPPGVDAALWAHSTPEQRKLWNR